MSATTPAARTITQRVYRATWLTIVITFAAIVCAAMITGAVEGFIGSLHTTPAPAACHDPDLPSGDEQRLAGGTVLVCTDGIWHQP